MRNGVILFTVLFVFVFFSCNKLSDIEGTSWQMSSCYNADSSYLILQPVNDLPGVYSVFYKNVLNVGNKTITSRHDTVVYSEDNSVNKTKSDEWSCSYDFQMDFLEDNKFIISVVAYDQDNNQLNISRSGRYDVSKKNKSISFKNFQHSEDSAMIPIRSNINYGLDLSKSSFTIEYSLNEELGKYSYSSKHYYAVFQRN